MKYSEVKELLQAGFTADEIRSMINPQNSQNNPQEVNTNVPDPIPENDSETKAKQAADQLAKEQDPADAKPEKQNDDEKFNQLNSTMEKLIRTIQSANLNNSSVPSLREPDIDTKVDSIMASIIRPEREKGGSDK